MGEFYLVERQDFVSVADTIRAKGETQAPLTFPNGFKSAINAISTGIPNSVLDNNGTRTSFMSLFSTCRALTEAPMLNTSAATSTSNMFNHCNSLRTVPFYDTANVVDFSYMFADCSSITDVPNFNTSKGTNFQGMFSSCGSLRNIGKLDLSKATSNSALSMMFNFCWALESVDFVLNSIKSNIEFSYSHAGLTDESLVNIANGLNPSVVKVLTLGRTLKSRVQSIMGNISEDLFIKTDSGTTSLSDFILDVKGWSIT